MHFAGHGIDLRLPLLQKLLEALDLLVLVRQFICIVLRRPGTDITTPTAPLLKLATDMMPVDFDPASRAP